MTGKAYGSIRPEINVFQRFEKFRGELIRKRGRNVKQSDALDELLKKAGF